jgi:hypothetical protein
MKILIRSALVLILAFTATACGSNSNSTIPTVPTAAATIVETFPGTITAAFGSDFHTFTVTQTGALTVTLTAASPPATIWMGIGVGTPSSSVCSLLSGGSANGPAGVNPQLSGTLAAGTYCVLISDIGNFTSTITYSVTVAHS